jgi:hypothetical protein
MRLEDRKGAGGFALPSVLLGIALLALPLAFMASCATSPAIVAGLVQAKAEPFPVGALPPGLLEELQPVSVVFLGETHYVAEHQAFLADLASGLRPFGFQLVLQEGMHCDGWAADDYVQGWLDALPPNVAAFDSAWLDRLRSLNSGLAEDERIHVAYFDMNHFPGEFLASLRLAVGLAASESLNREALGLLATDPRSAAYPGAVEAFRRAMDSLPPGLDGKWSRRLSAAAAVELRSLALRREWNDEAREALIYDTIAGFVAKAPEGKALVNCGLNHAEARPVLPGPRLDPARKRLGELPEYSSGIRLIYSLAAVPLSGTRIAHFYDKAGTDYDLLAGSSPANVLRMLGAVAPGRNCYLPLDGGQFAGLKLLWDDGTSREVFAAAAVFDGILVYPKGSIPDSLAPLRQ